MHKQAVVIHSGGLDSSLCLALARAEYGPAHVLSLSFNYQQRHSAELLAAAKIASDWGIDHAVVDMKCLTAITSDALTNPAIAIEWTSGKNSTSLVVGRNGLMARLGAIHAHHLGAHCIYLGIMEEEAQLFGYRDCSRSYMDLIQQTMRIDLADDHFTICTPLVAYTKEDVLRMAHERGILPYLLEHTISCYEGIPRQGCTRCPACFLKLRALKAFGQKHSAVALPYTA